jgi:hypothetical protein
MGSNERSGVPLKGRDQAQAVRVDLAGLFGRPEGAAAGIVTDRLAAGGLSHWLRTADGAWVGVVTYLVLHSQIVAPKIAQAR